MHTPKSHKRNLTTAWLNVRKEYDSLEHTWIIAVLEKLKIASNIRKTMENSMRHWHTTIELSGASIASVKINRGIFQGDSLSPNAVFNVYYPT